jgi:hypothetical protein
LTIISTHTFFDSTFSSTYTYTPLSTQNSSSTYSPASIGYVITTSSGSTFGDLYFSTRTVNTKYFTNSMDKQRVINLSEARNNCIYCECSSLKRSLRGRRYPNTTTYTSTTNVSKLSSLWPKKRYRVSKHSSKFESLTLCYVFRWGFN